MRYLLALAFFAASLVVRIGLLPVDGRLVFATFYASTILTLYFCGLGPGFLVIVLSAITGTYLLTPPYAEFEFDSIYIVALSCFLLTAAVSVWVVWQLQKAGRRLDESQRQLQAVVNDQTEMVFRFDPDGNFRFINPTARQMFGLSDLDLGGKTWRALVDPEDRPAVDQMLRRLSPAEPVAVTEIRFPGKGGETRWGEFVHRAFFAEDAQLDAVQAVGRDITERRRLQDELAKASAALQDLYDHAPCGYYSLDSQGLFTKVNATLLGWLGCVSGELVGKRSVKDFLDIAGRRQFEERFPELTRGEMTVPLECTLIGRDRVARHVSIKSTAINDPSGHFLSSRCVMFDVSELERVRRDLASLNRQQEAMLDNELIGIIKMKNRTIVWKNRALNRMFGYSPGELQGQPQRILYLDDESCEALERESDDVLRAGDRYRTQLQMRRKDGSPIWVDTSGELLSRESGESIWMMLDVTAMKEHQATVENIAFHDSLTGLPNRRLLMDRLEQSISLTRRQNGLLAVCFLDLDGLKSINDRHGHAAGDLLLKSVASRLTGCVRSNDTVARLAGDEFVLLLPGLQSREECDKVIERAVRAVGESSDLGNGVIASISASVGVAFSKGIGHDASTLLHSADAAMYEAKRTGRNRVRVASD